MAGGGGGGRTAGGRKKANIQIVPLIDVIFFLLATFIMYSMSMSKNMGVNVQLPGASTSTKQASTDDALTVSVMAKGEIFFNKDKINMQQLPFRISSFKAQHKEPKVIVNADEAAEMGAVLKVIDEIKAQGITKVGFATK
ncbi:MAG: ExbD/TolR family protein [Verrucomicrobiaceae bacterium]